MYWLSQRINFFTCISQAKKDFATVKTVIVQIVRICYFTVSVYKCLSGTLLERLFQDRSAVACIELFPGSQGSQ